jgi:N-acyl-D-aspartate/D-glutamate deacylase
MLDLRITGGKLIDGSRKPARRADIGVRGGRIVAIGKVDEPARETIDASDRVVAPGFVDVHTHYDAQVFWDGALSPSCFHGVTSVFAGNCGFSIAPLSPEAGPYLMRMLARVEGMPLESLERGVPWDWRSFGDYLGRLEGRLAINAGFMVGHSALRRVVMGERAVGSQATPAELEAMKQLLATSLREGGMGFSSTISPTHNDAEGNPVPSRHASREELLALARVCRDFPGTTLEFLPGVAPFGEREYSIMTDLSLAANRSINWNVLAPASNNVEQTNLQLAATDYARARGAEVYALTVPQPVQVRINLHAGFIFDALDGWAPLFRLPIAERMQKLRDRAYRAELDRRAKSEASGGFRFLANWERFTIAETFSPDTKRWQGKKVGEVAEALGVTPIDALVEVSLADGLHTSFMPPASGDDDTSWKERGRCWLDDRTIIGASDAGAHLDMIDTFAQTTMVLGRGVRRHHLLSLEEAIHQLTDRPARIYGLRERGRVEEGWRADLVVFDPASVDCGPTYTKPDLPAGANRLYADAIGITNVVVNGAEIIRNNALTGKLPGSVLRSGRDTETVEVPGGPRG